MYLLINPSYHLLKPIFHLGCPSLRPVALSGWVPQHLHDNSVLCQASLRCDISSPSPTWWLFLHAPSSIPCPGILMSCLCFLAQPLVARNFVYQLKSTRDRVPQHLTWGHVDSCTILGEQINIIQTTLDKIQNTPSCSWWDINGPDPL